MPAPSVSAQQHLPPTVSPLTYHNLAVVQGNLAGLGTVAVDILVAEVVLDMHLVVVHTVNFLKYEVMQKELKALSLVLLFLLSSDAQRTPQNKMKMQF